MGLIAFINSQHEVLERLRDAYQQHGQRLGYTIRMISSEQRIQETLNYDLPELVILNCADPQVRLSSLAEQVRTDSWLHSFGIIGLFDGSRQNEDEIAEQLRELNLLVLLDYSRIRSHLMKCVSIILGNRQLIFQREVSSHFTDRMSGSFQIDNDTLAVPIYAGIPVTNLAQMGLIQPQDKLKLQLALSELIINAVEHGNCGITYEEKTAALESGGSVVDLVQERCQDVEIALKRVRFSWESDGTQTTFTIRDDGDGFDVAAVREKTRTQDLYSQHGRGIHMAETIADELRYNDQGNEVTMVIRHREGEERQAPQGFSGEQTLFPQPGDVVFREGERGDFLYYISSGHFSVHHGGKQVGSITPADIFMGEMSFLLNNLRSATVIAETDAKLIKITRKAFVEVMKQYPHYGIFLSKLLARKLARSNEARSS
ncbi:ATP-binding protein [Spirochaeta africana]|uniref:Histidine kinase with cyclic nucleotide-binding domain n=1 Tax=Spirochaeta africana (strain ATCC 700263 / DSM 8902 / Z-7692) TaxID=889378 RepID=H9UGS1_SPIAZ|nr:ATP-binding protein [Spirochaeta africana]AFG36714.1 histidine kinase with cyclic nucleotide-binding domain [Spirochaeta africana DSM 8902]